MKRHDLQVWSRELSIDFGTQLYCRKLLNFVTDHNTKGRVIQTQTCIMVLSI
jgi:hypothetical protein